MLLFAAAGIVAAALLPPVAQDSAYHDFADGRRILGIDHFWNVVSNLPFVLVGAAGIARIRAARELPAVLGRCYGVFFAGVLLTGAGSAWYHLQPDNASLVWDRLPMTLAFMGLFAAVVGEYLSLTAARRLLLPLIVAGAGSVAWWALSEMRQAGDLRPYAAVQFLPLMMIPLILFLYRGRGALGRRLWAVLALYALAKGAEALDRGIFDLGGLVSGHTLKHLLAAAAAGVFLGAVARQGPGRRR